jgi:peptidoglycan lytic transglycosylase
MLLLGALLLSPVLRGGGRQTEEFGLASWYGDAHQGRTTASGEPFDEHQLTAAHRTWPMGSMVMVTNMRNGRSVVVRITDRGPAILGRIIDLSKAAAEQLGFIRRGLTPVKVSIIRKGGDPEKLSLQIRGQLGQRASPWQTASCSYGVEAAPRIKINRGGTRP